MCVLVRYAKLGIFICTIRSILTNSIYQNILKYFWFISFLWCMQMNNFWRKWFNRSYIIIIPSYKHVLYFKTENANLYLHIFAYWLVKKEDFTNEIIFSFDQRVSNIVLTVLLFTVLWNELLHKSLFAP